MLCCAADLEPATKGGAESASKRQLLVVAERAGGVEIVEVEAVRQRRFDRGTSRSCRRRSAPASPVIARNCRNALCVNERSTKPRHRYDTGAGGAGGGVGTRSPSTASSRSRTSWSSSRSFPSKKNHATIFGLSGTAYFSSTFSSCSDPYPDTPEVLDRLSGQLLQPDGRRLLDRTRTAPSMYGVADQRDVGAGSGRPGCGSRGGRWKKSARTASGWGD